MGSDTVQTVLGPIHADSLGTTQIHEHLILDYYPSRWGYEHILDDKRVSTEELRRYKEAGGCTVVELTLVGAGRDPHGLREISQTSGVHIVMGTGMLLGSQPSVVEAASADDLAESMVRDLTVGVGDTGIRAGIIGELGAGAPRNRVYLSPAEERLLRAGAKAHIATGALISIDTFHGELALEKLAILLEERVPPERVIIGHLGDRRDLDYYLSLAEQGACLGFDHVGMTNYAPDEWRVESIKGLIERGYADQIVLSMDVHRRSYWRCMGGIGYDYLLTRFVPMMLENGITEEQVHTMLVENPKRCLPFK
jgi:phosphotriesterase-related protein